MPSVAPPAITSAAPPGAADAGSLKLLTRRQIDVLALLCQGMPNKAIGRRLGIESTTVKVHLSQVFKVLRVRSRVEAVLAGYRIGLMRDTLTQDGGAPL